MTHQPTDGLTQTVPVKFGNTKVLVEVVDPVAASDTDGPGVASLRDALSFDNVQKAIESIAGELAAAWDTVKPAEAAVELGFNLKVDQGLLTALLVKGSADASLKVTLKWKPSD